MSRAYAAVPYEYFEEMGDLTDEEFGRLIRALLQYSMTGEESELPGNERFFWRRVVNRELGLQQHYEDLAAIRSEAGKKGAAARWGDHGKMAKDSKNGYVKDKVKDKDKVNPSPILGGNTGVCLMTHVEELRRLEEMGVLGGGGEEGIGAPGETQRSGFVGERTSPGMSEFSRSAGKRGIWR